MAERQSDDLRTHLLGVAEAKRRFSELIDRVGAGERFVVARRGRPAMLLVAPTPEAMRLPQPAPIGLAAVAGALSEWESLDEVVAEIYDARRRSHDRAVPELD
jgi:antitoxin (DNA-binding transcriptional repressor) of toxin-antitoxin stability system